MTLNYVVVPLNVPEFLESLFYVTTDDFIWGGWGYFNAFKVYGSFEPQKADF
jgi:hypothetical protein